MKRPAIVNSAIDRFNQEGFRSLLSSIGVYSVGIGVVLTTGQRHSDVILTRDDLLKSRRKYDLHIIENELAEYSLSEWMSIAPLQRDQSVEYHISPIYSFKPSFVATLRDTVIFGPHSTVIDGFGNVTGDYATNDLDKPRWMLNNAIVRSPVRVRRSLRKNHQLSQTGKEVDTGVLLYHQSNNIYHWVLEQIGKLHLVEEHETETGDEVHLILRNNPPDYVLGLLKILGYERDRYMEWSGEPIAVDRLLLPTKPEPTPKLINWIDNRIVKNCDGDASKNWIYISRQQASRGRRVANYHELEPILNEYDIEPIFFENSPIEKEIQIVANADGIISPHGAGLTSMLWGRNLTIVELFNRVVKAPYFALAHALGHEYHALSCTPTGSARRQINKDLIINPTEFRNLMEAIFQS